MFLSRYQDRPSTLKVDYETSNNGREGKVHSLNDFEITVWSDGEVTARRKYYKNGDPRSAFPNMTVEEGSINFPIEDLVSFLLARITPLELAEGIISNDEARAALLDKMAERYNEPGFTDDDRRTFLTKIQGQVHAVAIDRAVERLNKTEENVRSRSDYYRWKDIEIGHYKSLYNAALGLCNEAQQKTFKEHYIHPDKLKEWLVEQRDPIVMESVGPQWHESRDYWRAKLLECFPEPTVKEE